MLIDQIAVEIRKEMEADASFQSGPTRHPYYC
jgi:hypothetical protein